VEENLWPAGSPIAKPATSANGSNCLYKLTTALHRQGGPRESVAPLDLTVYFPPRVENKMLRGKKENKKKDWWGCPKLYPV